MQALTVLGVIVGLLWGAIILIRGGLLGGCLLVMLAGTCFSFDFFVVRTGAVPLTADRILWVVLLVQYAIWRRQGWADPKRPEKQEYLLCAFIGMLVLSTFTADWQAQDCSPVARLIILYLMPLGVYWVARQSPQSERSGLALFACLTVFGIYLAVTTIAEARQLWWLVFPKYIVTTVSSTKLEFIGRGRGPLLNPVATGMLLTLCLCGALMWWPRLRRPGRLVLAALVLLFCLGIYSTFTRSAWMGALMGLLIVVGLTTPRCWRVPVLGGGLLIATLVAATQWQNIVSFKRDRDLTARQTAESVRIRPVLAELAWHMFLDRPLLGCGLSQYNTCKRDYTADRSIKTPLEKVDYCIPHNVLLSLLTETGLVGLGLFVALVVLLGSDAWRLWRLESGPLWARQLGLLFLAFLGAYFTNGMFHDTSVAPMANMTLFFMAGVTAGLRPLLQPEHATALPSARRV